MEKQNQSADILPAASDQMSSTERGHLKIFSAMRQAWEKHTQCWKQPIWKKNMVQMLQ